MKKTLLVFLLVLALCLPCFAGCDTPTAPSETGGESSSEGEQGSGDGQDGDKLPADDATETKTEPKISEGLEFTSNGDGTCYISGIGHCIDMNIIFPSISPDGESVTGIGNYAFDDCISLTSVTIPDSVTSIGESAFSSCSGLKYNEYGNAYYLGNDVNPYLVLMKAGDMSIMSCDINDKTKVICSGAFSNCSSLTSVTIPDSVTSIGEWAFAYCSSLTSVTFENTDGWWRSTSSTATSEKRISGLADASTAATYLTSTYCSYYWYRD